MKDRSQRAVDAEPLLVGTLSKRAQGKSTFGRLNWKHRWFVLYNDRMEWWSNEGGRYNAQSECKGSIDLGTIHVVEHVSYDAFTKDHMFQIVHTSVLYVQCNTKAECAQWVGTIRQLVRKNKFLHPKYHPGFFDDKDKVWSCCGIPNREFKGCLGAFDYSQLPDRPVQVPMHDECVAIVAPRVSDDGAKPAAPLTVAKDNKASPAATPASAKSKASPAVLQSQENHKRPDSAVDAKALPASKRSSADLKQSPAKKGPLVVRPAKITYV
eukprot:TRINITY_DN1671_c0_g1_i2.p1 TRINITY_DN1671_c0_g1~~TRINITY_DN1671_c0_g1_i2.p1  ORF type:complete len:268 (+),score=24.36 TRINITY_DN1671_c0_g1_i2:182-985(+)